MLSFSELAIVLSLLGRPDAASDVLEVQASDPVRVRGAGCCASAERARYDPQRGLLVLEGSGTGAVLWRQRQPRGAQEQIQGNRIWYHLKTQLLRVDSGG